MKARELIAEHASRHLSAMRLGAGAIDHTHTECLAEADLLIESLRLGGYRVVGVTQLPEMERITHLIHPNGHPCNNDLCVCRPRS